MKGSKLLLVLLLFSSTILFAQEKGKFSFGIGVIQNNSNFRYSSTKVDSIIDSMVYSSKYRFLSFSPFLNFSSKKTNHQIGLSISPLVGIFEGYTKEFKNGILISQFPPKDSINYYGDHGYSYSSLLGITLNNEFKLRSNLFLSLNSQMIFGNENQGWGSTIPVSLGLTYKMKDQISINISMGNNFYIDGIKTGVDENPDPWTLKETAKSRSLNFGISYLFSKPSTIQPNKTYQF